MQFNQSCAVYLGLIIQLGLVQSKPSCVQGSVRFSISKHADELEIYMTQVTVLYITLFLVLIAFLVWLISLHKT